MSWATSEWAVKGAGIGAECFIGEGCFIVDPKRLVMEGRSRIDPGVHITAGLRMGRNTVVCSGAKLTGGGEVVMEEWSFVGYGAQLHTSTEKYGVSPVNAWWGATECVRGPVVLRRHAGVASGSIVLPCELPEGCAIGALSLVTSGKDLRPWWIHIGRPARPWKPRDREEIERMAAEPGFERDHRG